MLNIGALSQCGATMLAMQRMAKGAPLLSGRRGFANLPRDACTGLPQFKPATTVPL
jgi:hypothetical protein